MGRVSAAFARLSKRERILVGVMGGLVAVGVVFLINLSLSSSVSKLETTVATAQESLQAMYAGAGEFVTARQVDEARKQRAIANARLNITEAIAGIAGQISFESVDIRNNPTGRKRIGEYLDYAPPKDTPLGRKRRGAAREGEPRDLLEHYVRRDVEVTVRESSTFDAIYELLEKIEESSDLLFVTELRLDRDQRRPERAGRGKIVVSTFYYDDARDE